MADRLRTLINIDHEPFWLVRSSARILGPYSRAEVISLMQSRHFSIFDEIRSPESRWSYLRDHSEFHEVVENLRKDIDSTRDDTMTSTMTSTSTLSVSSSQATQTITNTEKVYSETKGSFQNASDTDSNEHTQSKSIAPHESGARFVGGATAETSRLKQNKATKSFGLETDKSVRDKVNQKQSSWMVFFIIILLLGGGAFSYLNWKKNHDKLLQFESNMATAIRLKNIGLLDNALIIFKKAAQIKEPRQEQLEEMALLLVRDPSLQVTAKKLFERNLQREGLPRSVMLESLNGLGLIALQEQKYYEAMDIFQKIIGFEPNQIPGIVNLAITRIRLGLMAEAFADLSLAVKQFRMQPLIQLTHALSGIGTWEKKKDPEILVQVIYELKEYLKVKDFMSRQLYILLAYAKEMLKSKSDIPEIYFGYLSTQVNSDGNYLRDAIFDWSLFSADYLDRFIYELYFRHKEDQTMPYLSAMRAINILHLGRESESLTMIDEALAAAPQNQWVLLAQVHTLMHLGNYGEAETLLKNIKEASEITTPKIFAQVELCRLKENYDCIGHFLPMLKEKANRNVRTFYYAALLAFKQGMIGEARERIKAGLLLEAGYLPLIELRDRIDLPGSKR